MTLEEAADRVAIRELIDAYAPASTAASGCATEPAQTPGARAAIDEQVWERTMNRLRRIVLLLSVTLATVVAPARLAICRWAGGGIIRSSVAIS